MDKYNYIRHPILKGDKDARELRTDDFLTRVEIASQMAQTLDSTSQDGVIPSPEATPLADKVRVRILPADIIIAGLF